MALTSAEARKSLSRGVEGKGGDKGEAKCRSGREAKENYKLIAAGATSGGAAGRQMQDMPA